MTSGNTKSYEKIEKFRELCKKFANHEAGYDAVLSFVRRQRWRKDL